MARIGFVGLGKMGLPMAVNLVKAKEEVLGFDLNKEAMERFKEAGGAVATSLKEVAREQDIIITMLQTGEQVLTASLSENGLYQSAPAHHCLHIDCSTIDVETAKALHKASDEKNLLSLDAPVSGGVAAAKAGSLTFMVGGREYDVEKARPVLMAMGSKLIHTGAGGSGQAAKMCNNLLLGISMLGVSEAFSLGNALGLDPIKLHEVLSNASGHCWVSDNYVPVPNVLPGVPANNDYKPGFTVAMMLKDLLLAQQAATAKKVFTPLAERATQLYQLFYEEGNAELDFSAIIKLIGVSK